MSSNSGLKIKTLNYRSLEDRNIPNFTYKRLQAVINGREAGVIVQGSVAGSNDNVGHHRKNDNLLMIRVNHLSCLSKLL